MLTSANHHHPITQEAAASKRARLRGLMDQVLQELEIDVQSDPNTKETADRWSRMMIDEVMAGRFQERPKVTVFPNTNKVDELFTVGPIAVRSMCAHHFVPILGRCWIGVIPGNTLLGLSKFARITDWVMRRPQIQEEATSQLADELDKDLRPKALGVVVRAKHLCMSWRGVEEHDSEMVTSVMRGLFRESDSARSELMRLIQQQGG